MLSGIRLFGNLFHQSLNQVHRNKSHYIKPIIFFILLSNFSLFLPQLGVAEESNLNLAFNFFITLLNFFVVTYIVFSEKFELNSKNELTYFIATFLLYNLYYSALFFIGLLFLIVPGIIALIFFSMAPFAAVFEEKFQGSFFKRSIELVKKDVSLVAALSIINLLLELSSIIFDLNAPPTVKLYLSVLFSIPESILLTVLSITSVKIYDHLQSKALILE